MAELETVAIRTETDLGFRYVNKVDYDPAKHGDIVESGEVQRMVEAAQNAQAIDDSAANPDSLADVNEEIQAEVPAEPEGQAPAEAGVALPPEGEYVTEEQAGALVWDDLLAYAARFSVEGETREQIIEGLKQADAFVTA